MRPATHKITLLIVVMTAFLLAACGGGSGDGDSFIEVPTAPAAAVSINAENAELISADVLSTVDIVAGLSILGNVLPAVQVESDAGTVFNYPDFFIQQLQLLSAQAIPPSNGIVSGIVITKTPASYDCPVSGTMTISGDVDVGAPMWIPTLGDQITIKFNACEELEGIVLNGTMSMTITELDTSPDTVGLDVVLTVLSLKAGVEEVFTDGDMSMRLVDDGSGHETLELWGNSLTAWGSGEVETLTNYKYFYDVHAADPNLVYSYELEGKLASTVIGGSVYFQMTIPESMDPSEPFEGVDAGDPYKGKLWITTDADTSRAHVIVLNSTDVQIDVYLDAVIVKNIMTTWDNLRSLL